MIREYKTIQEIASPLMIVKNVEGVTYDELAEIELPNGEVRRCKVLEVEDDHAVVQLFESAQGINLAQLCHNAGQVYFHKAKGVGAGHHEARHIFTMLGNGGNDGFGVNHAVARFDVDGIKPGKGG